MIKSAIIAGTADHEILKRFAGIVESLAHRQGRSGIEQTFWVGMIVIGTSRKVRAGAQERLSVTEARSRFGDA